MHAASTQGSSHRVIYVIDLLLIRSQYPQLQSEEEDSVFWFIYNDWNKSSFAIEASDLNSFFQASSQKIKLEQKLQGCACESWREFDSDRN